MPKRSDRNKQDQDTSSTPRKTGKQWAEEGDVHLKEKDYNAALAAYKEALNVDAWSGKAQVLSQLKRYDEAAEAQDRFEQLREEGYGDDDDYEDFPDLIIFSKEYFQESE